MTKSTKLGAQLNKLENEASIKEKNTEDIANNRNPDMRMKTIMKKLSKNSTRSIKSSKIYKISQNSPNIDSGDISKLHKISRNLTGIDSGNISPLIEYKC